jgi:PAS domain S-box-containing protein
MWSKERLGLIMILASLGAITVIIAFLFSYQQDSREAQIRSQGISLARLLSSIPQQQLAPSQGQGGILQVLQRSRTNPDFAYAVVVDTEGDPQAEAAAAGVIVPDTALPSEPSSWLGERTLVEPTSGRTILEFHAPLFEHTELGGYIRLGYFKPRFGLSFEQLPFFATLALPIFLLTPLFYVLIKREIRPLQAVNSEIGELIASGDFHKVQIHASGELGEFMRRFNTFIESIQTRIKDLQAEQTSLLTSTKVLSYKRARVEAVLQSLPEAVVVLDESATVSYANAKLATLLGVALDAVVGHRPRDWCEDPDLLAFLARYEGGAMAGFAPESMVFSPQAVSDLSIEVRVYPLFSPKDASQLLGTLIVFRDVTEEGLAKRSRGEFVAQVAHELKTPLNVLAMYSESLMGEDGQSEALRIEAVNVIHDEVERLATLINNLLSITKIEMGGLHLDRQRVRLHDLLEDAFNNVSQSGRGRGLKFQLELPKELSAVYVDKDLLRIAINNLLTNAIKYNRSECNPSPAPDRRKSRME